MDDFKRWVLERNSPVVLVASTPAAEAVVATRNGLGVVDLLRAFAQIGRLDGI